MKYKQLLLSFVLAFTFVGVNASHNSNEDWNTYFNSLFSFRYGDEKKAACHDINFQYANGWTRLHTATMGGKTLKVKEFLDTPGVNARILDNDGKVAMHHAMQEGNISIVVLLRRSKAGFGYRDKSGNFPLDYASKETLEKLRRLKIIDYYLK